MKSLIIYFSHTGENYMSDGIRNIDKGNTEIVAEQIASLTNGDLFEIKPIKEYPYNYRECVQVSMEEYKNNARPELKEYLADISDYDIIYIGYPIWCGDMPTPLMTQLEKLNFIGKIVKPFSTHEGSGLARSIDTIKKLCVGANVLDGLPIRGSEATNAVQKLQNWID